MKTSKKIHIVLGLGLLIAGKLYSAADDWRTFEEIDPQQREEIINQFNHGDREFLRGLSVEQQNVQLAAFRARYLSLRQQAIQRQAEHDAQEDANRAEIARIRAQDEANELAIAALQEEERQEEIRAENEANELAIAALLEEQRQEEIRAENEANELAIAALLAEEQREQQQEANRHRRAAYVPAPAPRAVAAPTQTVSPCSVCLYSQRDLQLNCNHAFCKECCKQLVITGQPQCPLCRAPFNETDLDKIAE